MELREITLNDISKLQKIANDIYYQIFTEYWTDNGLMLYIEDVFNKKTLEKELNNSNYLYKFIVVKKEVVGFVKVNFTSSDNLSIQDNCELEKIYISPNFNRMGIGKKVISEVIKHSKLKNKRLLFLCVMDTNKNAIEFYNNLGFKFHNKTKLGDCYFKEEFRSMNRMCLKL